jgi:hypothetical protein
MLQIGLPELVRQDTDMQRLWDSTNIIISISNDMLSFRKDWALTLGKPYCFALS